MNKSIQNVIKKVSISFWTRRYFRFSIYSQLFPIELNANAVIFLQDKPHNWFKATGIEKWRSLFNFFERFIIFFTKGSMKINLQGKILTHTSVIFIITLYCRVLLVYEIPNTTIKKSLTTLKMTQAKNNPVKKIHSKITGRKINGVWADIPLSILLI